MRVYSSILRMDESISVSPALDLGSALRAAKPRWHMAASDLFRTRSSADLFRIRSSATLFRIRSSAAHTVVRPDVVGQHRSNGAAPQSAAPGTSSRLGLISAVAMPDSSPEMSAVEGRRRAGSARAQRRAACGFRRGAGRPRARGLAGGTRRHGPGGVAAQAGWPAEGTDWRAADAADLDAASDSAKGAAVICQSLNAPCSPSPASRSSSCWARAAAS